MKKMPDYICLKCLKISPFVIIPKEYSEILVRGFYFLLAGKYGNNRDRELIVDSYDSLSETYTKLAVILAVQELGEASRNDFILE